MNLQIGKALFDKLYEKAMTSKDLSPLAKNFFIDIMLINGGDTLKNKFFADRFNVTERQIINIINELINLDFIVVTKSKGEKRKLLIKGL